MITTCELEGGVTAISLRNARALIARHGLPDQVELYQEQLGPHSGEHLVEVRWNNGRRHTFSGFAWGYTGEGPHGLETFFQMLQCSPPVSLYQIALWPQEAFPALTYLKGKDYGANPRAEPRADTKDTQEEPEPPRSTAAPETPEDVR